MAEAGRKTIIDKELLAKIKQGILEGNNLKETAKLCELSESTLYTWTSDNYLNLADKIEGWRRDRKLILAERNLEDDMMLSAEDLESRKVRQKASMFVAETLGKNSGYSKRTELTAAEGKDLGVVILPKRDESTLDTSTEAGTSS